MTKLPDGWRWVRLGDICSEDRQGILPNLPESELLPYLGLEHIESETGRILRNGKDGLRDEIQSNTFAFTPKHVLYGKLRPYLNKVALPSYSGKCSTELIPILPSKQIIREFLAWILRRSETVEIVMRGVTGSRMPRAKMKELFAMTVPLPPIEHQRRIVAVLDEKLAAVAQARQAAQAQLEAAQALPAAYLRAIFDSPEAQSWPRYRLGDVGSVLAGITKGRKLKIGTVVFSVPYLRVANVQDGYLNLSEITYIEAT
ncbi:MAG: restriction endonuclease subunit S, partial [Anaerolineae bacterium]